MNEVIQQLRDQVAGFGPNLLAGVGVLVVGWLVALMTASLTRKALNKVSVDNKIARWVAGPERKTDVPIELWAGRHSRFGLLRMGVKRRRLFLIAQMEKHFRVSVGAPTVSQELESEPFLQVGIDAGRVQSHLVSRSVCGELAAA
jgi:hypothetical protein